MTMTIRDINQQLTDNGWVLVAKNGICRQSEPNAGPGRLGQHLPASRPERTVKLKHLVIIEKTDAAWSAHVPALAGCVVSARSRAQALVRIQKALQIHMAGLQADGLPLPAPAVKTPYTASNRDAGAKWLQEAQAFLVSDQPSG